jgi:inner membrane protein YidH
MTRDLGASATGRAGDGGEPAAPAERTEHADGTEPDARFTFANERTFLAWSRTALALVVAGLAIAQLLPPFPGVPLGRHLLAVPLIVLGAVLSVAGYLEWGRNQRALRRGEPLPRSPLPRILAASIAIMAAAAAVLVLLSAALR